MSTIDEIFATISEEDLATSVDELLVIDPTTRQISLPSSELVFGVESDAHSERKYFHCSRYVGNNVDLASCFIRVNYRNANGQIDSHLVNDVTVKGDSVVFSWELHEKVTLYKGQVHFVVCAYRADKVEWHTTAASGIVLEGIEPDIDGIVAETGDAVAQLIDMVIAQTEAVKAEGATQISMIETAFEATESRILNEIEAKGTNTLASIPNDYTALGEAVCALARMAAPGIVCEVEGTSIVVDDASNGPVQNLRIFGRSTQDGTPTPEAPVEIKSVENPTVTVAGKNLCPYPYVTETSTISGVDVTVNADGSIALNGTATGGVWFAIANKFTLPVGTYSVRVLPDNWNSSHGYVIWNGTGGYFNKFNIVLGKLTECNLGVTLHKGATLNNVVLKPQIEFGGIFTDYEPYSSGGALPTTHTLHGIPVTSGGNYTDSNGQQWICDEIDLGRGVYVQRLKTISDFTLIQSLESVAHYRYSDTSRILIGGDNAPALCNATNKYAVSTSLNSVHYYVNSSGTATNVYVPLDYDITTNPIMVLATLATPIETPLTEAELASFKALHTNKPHTTVLNDQSAHTELSYVADTKLYIDRKIASILG